MTPEQKAEIDSMNYEAMLRLLRFAPAGHLFFVSGTEVCVYFADRMAELKKTADHVGASKRIGWEN